MGSLIRLFILFSGLILSLLMVFSDTASAAGNGFSVVLSPSPIVAELNPGTTSTLSLKIYNSSINAETLQIQPRTFYVVSGTNQIKLNYNQAPDISSWLSFSQPVFTVQPSETITEQLHINLPAKAGFSYSFALLISPVAQKVKALNNTPNIIGSVVDFVLINVNRPGAIGKLQIVSFNTTKHFYQWLPVKFNITFKNVGNTIVQPAGNIFIDRTKNALKPINNINVNNNLAYILPGTTRTITETWSNGFPVYQTVTNASGVSSQKLSWHWSNLSQFRYGRYYANLIAVYNNGKIDVPYYQTVSFLILPWELSIGLLIVVAFLIYGIWSFIHKLYKRLNRLKSKNKPKNSQA